MITSQPEDVKILKGHHVILEVQVDGIEPLQYQWYYENDIIPGMLNHTMYIHVCNELLHCIGERKPYCCIFPATTRSAGHYFCQVKNVYGIVNSNIATVIVTTSSIAKKHSIVSGFCYNPSTMEKPTSNKGLVMLQTQS